MRYYTNSEINTFNDCRRRWWLGTYRRLKPRFRKVTGAAPIGSRVHLALAPYYVPADYAHPGTEIVGPVDPRLVLEEIIKRDRAELIASLQAEPVHTGGWADEEITPEVQLKEFEKEVDLCRAMIQGYMEWLDESGADSDYVVVSPSEQAVEYEYAPGKSLAGRLDAQVVQISSGVHRGIDHKTGDFGALRSQLRDDDQMLRYEILRRAKLVGARSDGMVFNMIRKVKRSAAAKPPFFDRLQVNFNQAQLESAWTRTMGIIQDIERVTADLERGTDHRLVAYSRRNKDCDWKCEFRAVCPMFDDGSRAEDMLQSLFVQADPMERYPELTGGSE